MTENREMQEDLFRKFDDWFKTGRNVDYLSQPAQVRERLNAMQDGQWTELKVDGDVNVKDLYRILTGTAVALKGTSQ